jgi:hypothetical protein
MSTAILALHSEYNYKYVTTAIACQGFIGLAVSLKFSHCQLSLGFDTYSLSDRQLFLGCGEVWVEGEG